MSAPDGSYAYRIAVWRDLIHVGLPALPPEPPQSIAEAVEAMELIE